MLKKNNPPKRRVYGSLAKTMVTTAQDLRIPNELYVILKL